MRKGNDPFCNMPLKKLISSLYKVTMTPFYNQDYWKVAQGLDLVPAIHKPLIQEPQLVNEIICFLLGLVDTPADLTGAALIEPAVRHLVRDALAELGTGDDLFLQVDNIMNAWFTALKGSPQYHPRFLRRPLIKASPIFRVHLVAIAESTSKELRPLYRAYGYLVLKGLRAVLAADITSATRAAYCLTARYFMQHISADVLAVEAHPAVPTADYLDEFARQVDLVENNNSGTLSYFALSHRRRIEAILNHAVLRPHRHIGGNRSAQRPQGIKERYPSLAVDGIVELNSTGKNLTTQSLEALLIDDAGAESSLLPGEPAERGIEVFLDNAKSHLVHERPYLKRFAADIVSSQHVSVPFSPHHLNLFHCCILNRFGELSWGMSPERDAAIVFVEMLLHTGIDANLLLQTRVDLLDEKMVFPALVNRDDKLYLVHPSVVQRKAPFVHKRCRTISEEVWVPIPATIADKLAILLKAEAKLLFSYRSSGEPVNLSLLDVKSYLGLVNMNTPYNIRISIERLSSSFFPIYHSRYGLDPYICSLVSGKDFHLLYKTQLHYIHISAGDLESSYLAAYEHAKADINRNEQDCIDKGFLPIANAVPFKAAETKHKPGCDKPSPTPQVDECRVKTRPVGYGSPLIADRTFLRQTILLLKDAIRSATSLLRRHNLRSVYMYMLLGFACCLRPRNNPRICWGDASNAIGALLISDKLSRMYHEERYSPLTPLVRENLAAFQSQQETLRMVLASCYSTKAIQQHQHDLFFLVDEISGAVLDFTLADMTAILKEIGIEWTFPPNMPRHVARNHLFEAGLPRESCEAFMGHQHAGLEYHSPTSSSSHAYVAPAIVSSIEELLKDLGFAGSKEDAIWEIA